MRYFLEIAYKGTNYHGWQIQKNATSVQQVINDVLSTILRETLEITGSGRTDAGVHARQQYAHFDFEEWLDSEKLIHKFNSMLPSDIFVKKLFLVNDEAHARFDASLRSYEYKISYKRDPFLDELQYTFTRKVDVAAMNEASALLVTTRDFESFSKVKTDVNTFVCNVTKAIWKEEDNETLTFYVSADRFLRGMVRTLVGTCLEVGLARMSIAEFQEVINSKDRKRAGRAVPAKGLFLTEVKYPFIK